MAYTVLARRYRSQTFDDVVGQEPIASTLKNAISSGRIHHAYLFTGTRGVGKTSMARILAKALNCTGPKGKNDQPVLEPCGKCTSCTAIARGDDIDVIEIDGASNNSVDDVRDLISNCAYRPARSRFKVYIIDEVHMLSPAAFNALLKTLEEPPEHVKFIFATTEVNKVLPTILSRVQRFDFRNIPTTRIADHLKEVLKTEKIKADDPVIWQVAQQGNGSMRDALSLLDRLLATGESPITTQILEQMLGLPDSQIIFDLVDAIAEADPAKTLTQTHELLNRGIAVDQFLHSLLDHLRNLMLVATCGTDNDLIELDDAAKENAKTQSAKFDLPALVHMIALVENIQRTIKLSSTPLALLDATMVRLSLAEHFASIAGLAAAARKLPPGSSINIGTDAEKKKLTRDQITITPGANAANMPTSNRPAPPQRQSPPPRQPAPPPQRQSSPRNKTNEVPAFMRDRQPSNPGPNPGTNPNPGSGSNPNNNRQSSSPPPSSKRGPTQAERDDAINQPIAKQVMDLFNARLTDVYPNPQKPTPTPDPDTPASPQNADESDNPTEPDTNS